MPSKIPKRQVSAEPSEKDARRSAGRPRIELDLTIIEGLGRIGATAFEMAHVLPASQSTVEHRLADSDSDFSKAYKKGQALLNASLRRKQIQVAMTGNVTMLIWLGKQQLGQKQEPAMPLGFNPEDCTDEQLQRMISGESPEVVMGWRRR